MSNTASIVNVKKHMLCVYRCLRDAQAVALECDPPTLSRITA